MEPKEIFFGQIYFQGGRTKGKMAARSGQEGLAVRASCPFLGEEEEEDGHLGEQQTLNLQPQTMTAVNL